MQVKKKHIVLLVAGLGLAALLAVCVGRFYCHEPQRQSAWLLHKVTAELKLDSAQQAKLTRLVDGVSESRNIMRSRHAQDRQAVMDLLAQPTLPRDKSLDLVQAHIKLMQAQAPKLVAAFADFYDSLSPPQRTRLREELDKHFQRHHARHHW